MPPLADTAKLRKKQKQFSKVVFKAEKLAKIN
jgi:hypothetical protein